jgi:hypothetical protein
MRNKSFIIGMLVVGMLLMMFCPAFAAVNPEEKSQNVDVIIEKSGIQAQLAAIPATLQQQIGKTNDKDEKSQKIAAIVAEDFTAENIIAEIKRTLSEQYNEKYAREVLKFYNSNLGTKIVRCEIASSDPAFQDKVKSFDIGNYDQKRRQVINNLFKDTNIQEFYYLLSSSMYESLFQTLNALLPEGFQISASKMNEFKKKIKEQYYSEEYKQKLLADLFIMYEDITNDEVMEYSKFYRSKSGKWVNKCIETGMIDGFKVCTEKMVTHIAESSNNQLDDSQESYEEEEDALDETL